MTRARWWGWIAPSAVGLGLALALWFTGSSPVSPTDSPDLPASAGQPTVPPRVDSPNAQLQHRRTPRPTHVPVSVQEEALSAAIRGSKAGMVRCPLPAHVADQPPPLRWLHVDDGVLSFATDEAAGVREFLPPSDDDGVTKAPPRHALVWSGAYPGRVGRCEVRPIDDLVRVELNILEPDGSPAVGARVMGFGTPAEASVDGIVEVLLLPGATTRLLAYHQTRSKANIGLMVYFEAEVAVSPEPDLALDLQLAPIAEGIEELMDRSDDRYRDEHDERLADVERALSGGGVSREAADLLESWRESSHASLDMVDQFADHQL